MQTSSKRDLKLNIVIGMLNQVSMLVVNLISKQALRSALGLDYLGLQTVYGNFCDLFAFAFAGIGMAVLFSLYGPIEEGDHNRIRVLYRYYDRLYRRMSLLVFAVGAAASVLVLLTVNASIPDTEVIVGYLLYLCSIIVYNRFVMQHFFIIAYQKRYVYCLINGLIDLASLAVQVMVLNLTHSYSLFLLSIVLKNMLISGVILLYIRRYYGFVFSHVPIAEPSDKKSILGNVKDLILYRIGNVMLNSTDSILVSVLINTATSGCYSNYLFISAGVSSLIGSFYESIMSRVGQLVATHCKRDQFRDFWKVSLVGLWINGFSVACFYFLVQDFVRLWMGDSAILSPVIAGIITLNLYLTGMRQTTGTYRQSAGIFHKVGQVVVLRGVLNLVFSVLFGWLWGLVGILAATAVSNLITLYWYEPHLLYRYFGRSLRYEALYQILGLLTTGVCLALTGLAVSLFPVGGWLIFLGKAAVCAGVSNGCYFLFYLGYQRLRKHRAALHPDDRDGE